MNKMRQRSKEQMNLAALAPHSPIISHQNISSPTALLRKKEFNLSHSNFPDFTQNRKQTYNDTSFKIQIDLTPSKKRQPITTNYNLCDIKINDIRIASRPIDTSKNKNQLYYQNDENQNPIKLGHLAESLYKPLNDQDTGKQYHKTSTEDLTKTQASSAALTNSTNTHSTNENKKRSHSFMQNHPSSKILKPIQAKPPANTRKISSNKCPNSVRANDQKDFKLYINQTKLAKQKNTTYRDVKSRQDSVHINKLITSEECNYAEDLQERPKLIQDSHNGINDKMEQFFLCKKKRSEFEGAGRMTSSKENQCFYEGVYLIGGMNDECSARILFKYPGNKQSNIEGILPDMLFPQGIEICKKRMSDSMSELNTIQCQRYIAENNENCFVMPLKTDRGFEKTKNELNQNNFAFCICFKISDLLGDDEGTFDYIITQRVVCIVTYVPLFSYFFNLLCEVLNRMKNSKLVRLYEHEATDFLREFMNSSECERILEQIPQEVPQTLVKIGNNINIYSCIERMHIFKMETVGQITFILLLMLLEHSVVFISQSVNVISNLCLLFLNMIVIKYFVIKKLPFKWLHPFVSSIPHNALDILHSPVPLLGGIVLCEEEANSRLSEIAQQHENITFVQISEDKLNILNVEHHQQIEQCSTFQILSGLIKQSLCQNENELSKREAIFNCVNQFVKQKLAQRTRLAKLMAQKADVSEWRRQFLGNSDDYLLKELTRTQMFLEYLQE